MHVSVCLCCVHMPREREHRRQHWQKLLVSFLLLLFLLYFVFGNGKGKGKGKGNGNNLFAAQRENRENKYWTVKPKSTMCGATNIVCLLHAFLCESFCACVPLCVRFGLPSTEAGFKPQLLLNCNIVQNRSNNWAFSPLILLQLRCLNKSF